MDRSHRSCQSSLRAPSEGIHSATSLSSPATALKFTGGAIAEIVIGSVIGLLLIILLLICLCCRKRNNDKPVSKEVLAPKQVEVEIPSEKAMADSGGAAALPPPRIADIKSNGNKELVFLGKAAQGYKLEELLRASAEVLGKGTLGTAYKETLESGTVVAVRRLKDVAVAEAEYREKMEVVGKIDHDNLVLLRAYYFSRDEKLLVSDYLPMGSLLALLHEE